MPIFLTFMPSYDAKMLTIVANKMSERATIVQLVSQQWIVRVLSERASMPVYPRQLARYRCSLCVKAE